MSTDCVRLGVIGAGAIACNYHLPALEANEKCRLVALAEIDEEKAKQAMEKFPFNECVDDYRRLLDRDDIDAIGLFTCVDTHMEIIPAALDAGKHVFTQKPFAMTVEDAEALVEAGRRSGKMLVCSFMHRYFPHSVCAKQILDEGRIGRLEMTRHRNCIGSDYDNAVRLLGAVLDIGTHGVDVIRYFTGQEVVKVQAMMDGYTAASTKPIDERIGRPNETVAIMNYELSGGTLVTHEVHWTQRGGAGAYYAEHYGDQGSLFIKHPMASHLVTYCVGRKGEWLHPELPSEPVRGYLHHDLFLRDVLDGTWNSAKPEDGLAAVRILDACYRAAKTGETVSLEWS